MGHGVNGGGSGPISWRRGRRRGRGGCERQRCTEKKKWRLEKVAVRFDDDVDITGITKFSSFA